MSSSQTTVRARLTPASSKAAGSVVPHRRYSRQSPNNCCIAVAAHRVFPEAGGPTSKRNPPVDIIRVNAVRTSASRSRGTYVGNSAERLSSAPGGNGMAGWMPNAARDRTSRTKGRSAPPTARRTTCSFCRRCSSCALTRSVSTFTRLVTSGTNTADTRIAAPEVIDATSHAGQCNWALPNPAGTATSTTRTTHRPHSAHHTRHRRFVDTPPPNHHRRYPSIRLTDPDPHLQASVLSDVNVIVCHLVHEPKRQPAAVLKRFSPRPSDSPLVSCFVPSPRDTSSAGVASGVSLRAASSRRSTAVYGPVTDQIASPSTGEPATFRLQAMQSLAAGGEVKRCAAVAHGRVRCLRLLYSAAGSTARTPYNSRRVGPAFGRPIRGIATVPEVAWSLYPVCHAGDSEVGRRRDRLVLGGAACGRTRHPRCRPTPSQRTSYRLGRTPLGSGLNIAPERSTSSVSVRSGWSQHLLLRLFALVVAEVVVGLARSHRDLGARSSPKPLQRGWS